MHHPFSTVLVFLFVCFYACTTPKNYKENTTTIAFNFIDQNTGLTDILRQAESENKLIFVDVYATWCRPCQMMDEEVFSDEKLAEYFNAHFINYKVNAEKGRGIRFANEYNVRAYPTLLFLNAKGEVLEKKEGVAYFRELKSMAKASIRMSDKK